MKNYNRVIRAQTIFMDAIDCPQSRIDEFLKTRCKGDKDLLTYCRKLISNSRRDENIIDALYGKLDNGLSKSNIIGSAIDGYIIRDILGKGGMAEVYLAQAKNKTRQKLVALKIVPSSQKNDILASRFYRERKILANLKHPYIARFLDSGTTNCGEPYFVMEYVDGIRIDEYCRIGKLTFDETLKLFVKLCSAIEYAHSNLIIHRDIKPANILVKSNGTPTLLDFGIAKILDTNTNETETSALFALTRNYASPEQLFGEALTTSTDIYSLGVLLYELLCSVRPPNLLQRIRLIQSENQELSTTVLLPSNMVDSILRESPKSKFETAELSLRRNRLKGDIDSILLRALEENPGDRYQSIQEFSNDIERHIRHI